MSRQGEQQLNPLVQLQRTLVTVRDQVGNNLQQHAQRHVQPWQRGIQQQLGAWWSQTLMVQAHQHLMAVAAASSSGSGNDTSVGRISGRGLWAPMMASVTMSSPSKLNTSSNLSGTDKLDAGASTSAASDASTSVSEAHNGSGWFGLKRKLQPLYELGMPKDEVKARLAPIPVFTIANPKNEFVLVAGENNTQLGFFFFKKGDAESVVEKIREENPRLARDSKILRVTMDNVYEVFTTPRDQTGLQGIHFRFMPDMRQISHALQLYKDAGLPTRQFMGVPVFQAEGLTVTTQELQYVPLFLCKEDLDIAVQSAYRQRNATQISMYKDKANKLEEEYTAITTLALTATGREKTSAESRASKARSKLDAARAKAEAVEKAPLPKIEVGSFEEVMMRMSASSGNELAAWNQVMFVAPGLLQQAMQKEQIESKK